MKSYAVDLPNPDITCYAEGNTGIPYLWSWDSGKPGPHLMISALVHGNELCGAITLDLLMRQEVRPIRGRLSLVFVNYEAYRRFDPDQPTFSRFVDEDLNRVWDDDVLAGERRSLELERARSLRRWVSGVDTLLDLHSMQHTTQPLILTGPLPRNLDLARAIGFPATIVIDEGHAAGRRLRDHGRFGDPDGAATALLVECGQHWSKPTDRVAIETTMRFLDHHKLVDPDWLSEHLDGGKPAPQRIIEVTDVVTVRSNAFRFVSPFRGMEVIPNAGDPIGTDGDAPVVAPYDKCVLIMPSQRLNPGQTAVRLGRYLDM